MTLTTHALLVTGAERCPDRMLTVELPSYAITVHASARHADRPGQGGAP
ncbi:hypothetical protein ACFYO5_36370 [Streptomyces sp. NPDC006259]